MLKIRRPLGRLIFNMGIAIPGKTVFLIETAPCLQWSRQRQLQDETRNIHVLGFGVTYIRGLTVCPSYTALSPLSLFEKIIHPVSISKTNIKLRVWISNLIYITKWDVITNPFSKFNDGYVYFKLTCLVSKSCQIWKHFWESMTINLTLCYFHPHDLFYLY